MKEKTKQIESSLETLSTFDLALELFERETDVNYMLVGVEVNGRNREISVGKEYIEHVLFGKAK